jgi:hypothetical protein
VPRYNKCSNPSAAISASGYFSSLTVSRITGLSGPPRTTGVQISIPGGTGAYATSLEAPRIAAVAGQSWTMVGWVRSSVARRVDVSITGYTSGGAYLNNGPITQVNLVANVWTQIRVQATLSGATLALISFNIDFPISVGSTHTVGLSSARYEQVSDAALTYADGDDSGWLWDGTAGSSTSTFPDVTPKTATDAGTGTDSAAVAGSPTASDSATGTDGAAVARASTIPDTGTGADAVALQQQPAVADGGIGVDSAAVETITFKSTTDSGTGDDSAEVLIPALKTADDAAAGLDTATVSATAAAADSGTGTDSATIARTSTTTDAGSGADAAAVQRSSAVPDAGTGAEATAVARTSGVAETGTGDEAVQILRFSATTDSGTGAEALSAGPFVIDGGTGVEDILVVEIPYTAPVILRQGTVYDLVVVARIPAVSGPPAFLEVDSIEWGSLKYTDTLSRPQQLTVTCLAASVTESVLQRLRAPARLATELWLYRDGRLVFAGPLRGFRTSAENLTLEARGLLDYLAGMTVQVDQRFAQVDQFAIAAGLIDQWQALQYGHYGIDTSGVGVSGRVRDATYLATELHNVGQRVQELGQRIDGFDVGVDPSSRQLQLWYPGKGVDRSTGEDAIVFDARNITNGDVVCSLAVDDVATDAFGTGSTSNADTTLYSAKVNLALAALYGRSSVTQAWSDISEQATLDAHTQGLVDARGDALLIPGPGLRVTPDADLDAYAEGDSVAYTLSDVLGINGAFRIRSRAVDVASTGTERATVAFV